jgi:DNA-binding transcriptional ArsR family regulator
MASGALRTQWSQPPLGLRVALDDGAKADVVAVDGALLAIAVYALTGICLGSHTQEVMPAATVFQALGEPRRLAIVEVLRDGERPVGDLVDELGLSQPAVSKHLRVLKDAGLVEVRVDAQRRLYRIRPEPLAELDDWLAPYRQLWAASLDRLEAHLDRRRKR